MLKQLGITKITHKKKEKEELFEMNPCCKTPKSQIDVLHNKNKRVPDVLNKLFNRF